MIQRLKNKYAALRSDPHVRELVIGAGISFALKVTGAAFSFAFNVLLAKKLGAAGSGAYFLALTVVMAASIIARMGFDNVLLRNVAHTSAEGKWAETHRIYSLIMRSTLLFAAILTVCIFVLAPWIAFSLFSKPEIELPLRWLSLAILPISIFTLHVEALKGIKRVLYSQIIEGLMLPVLSLAGLWFLVSKFEVMGAVVSYTTAALAAALLGRYFWCKSVPKIEAIDADIQYLSLFHSATPLFWVTLIYFLMNSVGMFLLGSWGSSEDVGVFGMAMRIALLVNVILVAFNTVAAPKFAVLYKQGNLLALGKTARQTTQIMMLFSTPILAVLIIFPAWVMGLFGSSFVAGASALSILAIGQLLNVAAGSTGPLLMMTGHAKSVRNSVIISTVCALLLSFLLIPQFGIVGAAIANTVALVLLNIVCLRAIYTQLGSDALPILWLGKKHVG